MTVAEPRSPLSRQGTELYLGETPVRDLADAYGTPLYAYDGSAIDEAYKRVDNALAWTPHLIAYAVKANGNLALLARLAKLGCGADIVSIGELERALRAGFPAERIVFSGVGKRDDEIERALRLDVIIHLESTAEAAAVDEVARKLGVTGRVAIRVNPDVDPKTHPYIATGLHGTKFGLETSDAAALGKSLIGSPALRLEGLACHIGSQVSAAEAMREAVARVGDLWTKLRTAGAPLRKLDAGGGWPITYGDEHAPHPEAAAIGTAIREGVEACNLRNEEFELVVEPGRYLVGSAGVLITRVLFVKDQPNKRFVIVDAAMNDFIRPALYEAHHDVLAAHLRPGEASFVQVVGPVCESGDFFAAARALPPVERGDVVVLADAGAYGMSMASQYNSRPRAAEVLVEGTSHRIIRERESLEDLWRHDRL